MATPIYHIVEEQKLGEQKDNKAYVHPSLELEGFIHCSYLDQVDGVIDRYYKEHNNLILLKINPDLLKSDLVVEPSSNGELFPHIYGPINWDCIVERTKL